MKQVTILFFATLRDLTGERRISKTIFNDLDIAGLKTLLIEEFPALNNILDSVIVSMNHEYAFNDAIIISDAEIAFFPPVSGG